MAAVALGRHSEQSGSLGEINYARGTYFQDMTYWPAYWMGLPPIFYVTHAIAPILRLLDATAVKVSAIGGGRLAPGNRGACDAPTPAPFSTTNRSRFQSSDAPVEDRALRNNHWPTLMADLL